MSDKPILSVFRILSRIFLVTSSFICLLMGVYYLLLTIRMHFHMYGSMIACLVLALLFIPIYDRTLKILSRSYGKSISKATPFIKGGLFVLKIGRASCRERV